MWRQVLQRLGRGTGRGVHQCATQLAKFAQQGVDLLLLAHNDLIQLVEQIFLETRFDFQIDQALLDLVSVLHAAFCQESRCTHNGA